MTQIQVELQQHMGNDRTIAEAAWTSSTTQQGKNGKTDAQVRELIGRLARDGHSTPFEHVLATFWLKIPVFVDRQLMTHRIASHSGMSGRYRTMPTEFFKLPADVLDIEGRLPFFGFKKVLQDLEEFYNEACDQAVTAYGLAIDTCKYARDEGNITAAEYKRLRELLRGMLPQAAMTERVSTFNLRSFANFQRLRNSEHAQPEIKEVAVQMLAAVKAAAVCPAAIETLEQLGWRI